MGGLVASIAFVLHSFAHGTDSTMEILRYKPLSLIPIGLGVAVISMFLPAFFGLPVMTSLWLSDPIPVIGAISTALFFDVGVYLVVIGTVLTILFTISLETH